MNSDLLARQIGILVKEHLQMVSRIVIIPNWLHKSRADPSILENP